MRVSGLLVFAPFLGSEAIAPRIKVGLVVLLTALLYPVCGPRGLSLTAGGMLRVMLSRSSGRAAAWGWRCSLSSRRQSLPVR